MAEPWTHCWATQLTVHRITVKSRGLNGPVCVCVCVCVCAYGWVCKCSHAWRGYGSPTETADLYTITHTYPDASMMNALRTHLPARNCICTHSSGPEVRQDADYPFYVDVRSSVPPGLFLTWPILLHCVMLHHCVLLQQTCATVSRLPA